MTMDPTSFGFLFLMIIVGGFVAWYGDTLGSKLGKKRITLFKMRPRKFAALMTFIFGALGTLLTILILFAASEPIRTWILEGNAARARLAATTQKLSEAETKFDDAKERLDKIEPELSVKILEIDKKNSELEDAKIEQLTLNSKNKDLDRRGKDLLKKVSVLTSQFNSVNTEFKKIKQQKEEVQSELDKASKEYGRLKLDTDRILKRSDELEREAVQLEKQSQTLQAEYKKLQTEFANLENASIQANAKFNSQLKTYQQELSNAEAALARTLNDLDRNLNALDAFKTSQDIMRLKLINSRYNAIIYPAEGEINRTTIPAGISYNEARNALTAFLKQTAAIAKNRGAEQTFEGSYAELLDDIVDDRPVTVEQQLDAVARALVRKNTPSVLIAVSKFNAFEKEFLPLALKVYDNVLAYEQGDVIFTMQIDGRKPVGEIATSIIELIDTGLAKTLEEHNMIPVLGSTRPFGEFSNERVIELALEIKESGIPLRLQLLAAKDTYSADRIVFNHRLRP